jgi:Sulfotransferase family
MSAVEVLEVPTQVNAHGVRAFAIERPDTRKPAGPGESCALNVQGWVVGEHGPAAVEVIHEDASYWRTASIDRPLIGAIFGDLPWASQSGFSGSVGTLALPVQFELSVVAALDSGERVRLAVVRGRRKRHHSSFAPALAPLMVTALGRTGSTMVMRLLGAHPDVVVYRPFEYEPRVSSYWLDVLRELAEPASYLRQFTATGLKHPGWWLGIQSAAARPLPDAELEGWIGSTALEEIASFCQSRIEAVYTRIAEQQGRPRPRYFAEKYRPSPLAGLMRELYPEGREVILVRDFRDMVASMFAYNEKRGIQGFRRDRAASDADYLRDEVAPAALALARTWQSRRASAHLLRYEELVERPADALARLFRYLEVDDSSEVVDSVLGAFDPRSSFATHGTSPAPEESIGRWRSDLDQELRRHCEALFAPALETFGYPL